MMKSATVFKQKQRIYSMKLLQDREGDMAGPTLYEKLDLFYLGREIDPDSGKTTKLPLLYKNKHLTTHAAIIGMTGSGKTGLGVCLLEEAAIDRLPAIVIDPKGDMANLLLTFPEMRGEDFLPWVDAAKAEQKGVSTKVLAEETAQTWDTGIQSWDQDRERISRLKASVDFSLFTPGSSTGNPVSVLDSLEAPEARILEDNTTAASVVNSTVSSLLGLIGIEADPLTSREHILLSSLILHFWRQQVDLSLESLIGHVVSPPFDRVGVFGLDSFYPQAKRMELAMQLNNIIASPAFSSWVEGEPLRIDSLLYTAEGKPRVSIFSIAHLSESERMFFVTMLLGKMISWMRRQEGTDGLRCLLYMDEIFGFFPPLGNPPSKEPMLLLLKQARAYGLGIILATQNPVDLDYKGLSNIGTWFIGRLQTKQDQDKVITGISGSGGGMKPEQARHMLANMRGRTFLMQSAHLDQPVLFETRWVLSYLKGPISLTEISRLVPGSRPVEQGPTRPLRTSSVAGPDTAMLSTPPPLPGSVGQCFVPPPVPAQGLTYLPWLAASATVRFFDQTRGIDQQEAVKLKIPLDDSYTAIEWAKASGNSIPMEMTSPTPPDNMRFKPLPGDFSGIRTLGEQKKGFADFLYRSEKISLKRVAALKLESCLGETDSQFHQRIVDRLREEKNEKVRTLKQKYIGKEQDLDRRLEKVHGRLEKEKSDVWAKGVDTMLSFGVAIFGAIAGRKAMSISTATRSAQGVRGAGRVLKEKGDVRKVEEELRAIEAEKAYMAQELEKEVSDVTESYDIDNFPVEEFFITPRRSDIYDVNIYLQWEPVMDFSSLKG